VNFRFEFCLVDNKKTKGRTIKSKDGKSGSLEETANAVSMKMRFYEEKVFFYCFFLDS